jgi:hypothetical protein|uniref:Uncharacterized protein n=1 Tax=viral metagenome TaxID=1070528 RepID=A0A6C0ILD9_9ZZZZ
MDCSLHLEDMHCKSEQMNDCVGPVDSMGAVNMQEVVLFFNDISGNNAFESALEFDYTTTMNNGIYGWVDGSSNTANITFSNLTSSNAFVFAEIYARCDATAGNNDAENDVLFDLSAVSHDVNSLSIIDIDTRSVYKGDQAHLSFGPSASKPLGSTNTNTLTVHKNNAYRLKVKTGGGYSLTEVKLIIKVRDI